LIADQGKTGQKTKDLAEAQGKMYETSREMQRLATSSDTAASMVNLLADAAKGAATQLGKMSGGSNSSRMTQGSPSSRISADGAKNISDLIAAGESQGSYTKIIGGAEKADLTSMSVADILDFQKKSLGKKNNYASDAVGKYQVTGQTLESLVGQKVVSPDDKFDSATQDKIFMALMERRGLGSFLAGGKTSKFADNLAKEWAALPYGDTGKSYYDGVAGNKSNIERDQLINMLEKLRNEQNSSTPAAKPGGRTGGIFRGPSTGYNVELHGEEIVVPANTAASKQALNTSIFNQDESMMGGMMSLFEEMNRKYDSMIDLLSRNADNSDKLVQATM
jgi:muramidase (phage lysozyme)